MAKNIWHYQENQFDNATENSNKRMNILASDHKSRLAGESFEPVISELLKRFEPVQTEYELKYSEWITSKGFYKGETARIDNYLEELSTSKIKQWDVQIQNVYLSGTPDYISILPNGRKPFQTGPKDSRIAECRSLIERLRAHGKLDKVRDDVNGFLANIEQCRDNQQAKEEIVKQKSDALEEQRTAVAVMMYKNLGLLMDKFGDAPENIDRFFQLDLLRQTRTEEEEVEPIPPLQP